MKKRRHQAILDIVQRAAVASQGDIVRELARVGIEANQGTVSRDIQELGLVKVPAGQGTSSAAVHRYAVPAALPSTSWEQVVDTFRTHVSRVDAGESLVVVKTPPGHAHLVGVLIDGLRREDIVGTIAGDDTLLIVPRDRQAKKSLLQELSSLLEAPLRRPRMQAAAPMAAAVSR